VNVLDGFDAALRSLKALIKSLLVWGKSLFTERVQKTTVTFKCSGLTSSGCAQHPAKLHSFQSWQQSGALQLWVTLSGMTSVITPNLAPVFNA
jgi:hypothetical protein